MNIVATFQGARGRYEQAFLSPQANRIVPGRWQGVDVSTKPEMATWELLNQSFCVPLRSIETLEYWATDTGANLPWADVHFAERVGGNPLNPGESWKSWPWGHSADKFRIHEGQFDHTYMERFWPKYAGYGDRVDDLLTEENHKKDPREPVMVWKRQGIRFEYGDLNDLVEHLLEDPTTRQAYLPVWFPEDGTCKGRKPCTLGYHFIQRYGYLHITYYIRSCDFVRHWGDDCYLAVRLLLWILDRLRERDGRWLSVMPGLYTMHIVSLHIFENDRAQIQAKASERAP